VSAVKANLTRASYAGSSRAPSRLSDPDVEEIEDAADLTFGLERDM
jgi:hypothetical protein